MEFKPTAIDGAFLIVPRKIGDERGFFARAWCQQEFADAGLNPTIVQSNMAVSKHKGTLRGLHYQTAPHQEVKIVRCSRGAMFDVIVDVRPDSPTYKKWVGYELNTDNHHALYVPEGCATGYMTLTDDVEMYYHTTAAFAPEAATGVRYDDPAFGIEWPLTPTVLSDQDTQWPHLASDA
ncbi:MAG: dTDP-4-dehydrorhamnose 3,5-epimerase [Gammaproteobacteria bacterium]